MKTGFPSIVLAAAAAALLFTSSFAADLRITLPKHSKLTPVQQLNRDGVKEVQKHHIDKAKRLFYKAYLLDPDDPFTLNNLGYISELEGDANRALKYYELSSKSTSQAKIDVASRPDLKGKPIQNAFALLQVPDLEANKANVQAISLVGQGRYGEAETLLRKAVNLSPNNPFTLNNLGYVMEAEGDLQSALRYYSLAASMHSDEKVLVAPNVKWRGKGISDVASQNARAVNQTISRGEDLNAQVARLNVRGVAALNHNDPKAAKEFFEQAYKLDPKNAFSLNNMGYVTELEGDRETAATYYDDARKAADANAKVTYATRREAEGQRIGELGDQNQADVNSVIETRRVQLQREGGPIQLKRRDNSIVIEPEHPVAPLPEAAAPPAMPAPTMPDRTEQTPTVQPGNVPNEPAGQAPGGIMEPLPESQQPPAARSPQGNQSSTSPHPQNQAPQGDQGNGGLLMPLPESQQPPSVRNPQQDQSTPSTQQPQAQPQTQPQSQASPQNDQNNGGLLMPLPESQQPPAAKTPQPNQQGQTSPQ